MLVAPAQRNRPMVVLRSAAITCGMAPVRTWERSSSKVTSRTQWDLFSIVFPQMTKRLMRASGVGGHDVAELHVVAGHDDAVDQELHQRPLLRERRVVQPGAHLGAERLDRGGQCLQVAGRRVGAR
jgi:hypothetical protein